MSEKTTYKSAGVDVEAGYAAVDLIKAHAKRTLIDGVMGGIGGFGGMFEIPEGYKRPVLVSGTDGVGTKLQLAFLSDTHNTIGIDCVAMCVNDIICQGAKPLFFLDYIGVGKLDPNQVAGIVEGVSEGCVQAGCALIGGETAEMPGFYKDKEYDIAGFCVGIVEKDNIITGEHVKEGNRIIGIASTGLHSNGFSLARKVLELDQEALHTLLTPTKIYVKTILSTIEKYKINAIANITGGGFIENIPRALPNHLKANISLDKIKVLPIFEQIQAVGNIETKEMYNTFNMGVGMVMMVDREDAGNIISYLKSLGEEAYEIGCVSKRESDESGISIE